ncbi:carbamoyltransferase HypF [Dialister sp.]|uniref:carbamoyltransferase HypF n=1 Tax=Dialister sp. TaxID=1955814 RepID=UPI002E81E26B|nr:carbamoyltransferase HypF [Dialister sp.]MEE3453130.1 carbamoyltransferase HypF [Dialister sp.]
MKTIRLIAAGRVQGVGFRPFVVRLAKSLSLTGWVKNLGGIVEIRASGEASSFLKMEQALREAPYPIEVEKLEIEELPLESFPDFQAIESSGKPRAPLFPADIAICPDCEKELHDEKDRHFHYPFLSCTACGPRYTIIRKLPYDRPLTTMEEFPLCGDCEKEYRDLKNRRCHGETICCENCGPVLKGIIKGEKTLYKEEAMNKAIEMVRKGAIIMTKSIGGFNLAVRADFPESVRKLRTLKHREGKPFALMVSGLEKAGELAVLSGKEKKLLASPSRPIVLCRPKVQFKGVAENVPRLGLFLPPSAFYTLLTENAGAPLIVTSCNTSGSPILYKDQEAEHFFETHDIPALFTNNREILRPADDSVLKAVGNHVDFIRRTRGFLPEPVIRKGPKGNLLALGADMEPSICLTGGGYVYPGEMPCELTEEGSEEALLDLEKDWEHMLGISPEKILCDLHPGYISENLAEKIVQKRAIPLTKIQHHHAHALSVMAEHGLKGPALAFIFDGTGYGNDGTIWGGEILLCEGKQMKRMGHLESLPLLSGDNSMKQAWKTALCDLHFAGIDGPLEKISIAQGPPSLGSWPQSGLRGCSTSTRENEEITSSVSDFKNSVSTENIETSPPPRAWGGPGASEQSERVEGKGLFYRYKGQIDSKASRISNFEMSDAAEKIAIPQGPPSLGSCRQGRLRGCTIGTRENEEAGPSAPNPQAPIPKSSLTDPRYPLVKAALEAKINVIEDSAMGRLFDSVSAILGICSENRFKGECAMALEKLATEAREEGCIGTKLYFTKEIRNGELLWGRKALIHDLLFKDGTIKEKALGFHEAIARMIAESAKYFQIQDILLSGGCFHNSLLWTLAEEALEKEGFRVYGNEKVPCGDGGIALGQAFWGLAK